MIQTRLDYEDDAVSITSSHSEQYDSDQEFLVERVLAEKKGEDGNMYFLISWADYPEEKSTWEPKENIQDPEILRTWKKRKDQEDRGLKPKFSIARFNARLEDFARAKEARRRRRKNKRRRLGIPVSPETEQRADDSDSSEAVGSDGALEDYQEVRRKAKAAQKAKKPDIEPLLRRRGSIHRDSYESDGASRSDDPVRGETQAKAVKKAKKQALEAVRDKKAAQASSKVGRGKEEPGPKKAVEVSCFIKTMNIV
jgi:chromo domain-containing protein 1